MTPACFSGGFAGVWYVSVYLDFGGVGNDFAVRPVINVTTEGGFTSGDGISENPYVID